MIVDFDFGPAKVLISTVTPTPCKFKKTGKRGLSKVNQSYVYPFGLTLGLNIVGFTHTRCCARLDKKTRTKEAPMAHPIKEKDPTLKRRAGQAGVEANRKIRSKRFEIRFTPEEWVALQQRASEAGASSAAIYARSVLLPSNHLADQETKAEHKLRVQLLASLGKIGSNINQIARSLNRMKMWNDTTKGMFQELTKIQEGVSTISQLLKEKK